MLFKALNRHLRVFLDLYHHAFGITDILEIFIFFRLMDFTSFLFAMIYIIEIDALYSVHVQLLV